jgi:dolichyl-phosphate-mannose--protein O-mannosyl transferase
VTSVGNPLIWWLGAASFVVCLWWLVRRGDWRAGVVVAGFLAGWVPWLFFPERTIFTFYVIAFAPFVYIGVAYVAFRWWTWSTTERAHAWVRPVIVFIGVLVVALSVFFYPVWTAIPVPYDFWRLHMWFPTWI